MYKELIIIIIVVALVVVGNIITQNNTRASVKEVSENLIELREEITKQDVNQEEANKKMEEVSRKWEEKYDTMAYYIEHNELEKVETELTKLKAAIEMKEYSEGVESLDACSFLLEHIKDKTALKVVNIF